ncbi:MAG: SH3 domain-containing protein [Microgenomates group bacterium]
MSMLACVLPILPANQGVPPTVPPVAEFTETPTIVPSPTPFQEVVDCKDIKTTVRGTVDASPIGLYLRKTPEGEIITVIPHKTQIDILAQYENGWSLVRWVQDLDNIFCGYAGAQYIVLE